MGDYIDEDYFKLESFQLDGSFCSDLRSLAITWGLIIIFMPVAVFLLVDNSIHINLYILTIIYIFFGFFLYIYYFKIINIVKNKTYNKVNVDIGNKYLLLYKNDTEKLKIVFDDIEYIRFKKIKRQKNPIYDSYNTLIFCFYFCIVTKTGKEYKLAISSPDFRILLDKHLTFKKW